MVNFQKFTDFKLISVDIFDTILFRTCAKSTDVYYQVGFRALERKLLPNGWTAKSFQEVRMLAEVTARKNKKCFGTDEVTLEEIYQAIPQIQCCYEQFVELELQTEEHLCYVNPAILELIIEASQRSIPIVLISDMYLAEDHIRRLLQAAKFPLSLVDHIIVSNEYGVGKSSGKLFQKIFEFYSDIDKRHIIHIGDNRTADIVGARLAGIQVYHYNVISEQEETIFALEDIYCGDVLPELRSLRKLAVAKGQNHALMEYFQIGAGVLGPFLTAFCEWVVDVCKQEKKSKIIAFMREGTLFNVLLEECAKHRGINLDIKLLYISRHASDLAGLKRIDEGKLQNFFSWRDVTVANLLTYLGFSQEGTPFQQYDCKPLTECEDISKDGRVSLKTDLINWLLEPKQQQHINNLLSQQRKLLVEYVKQNAGSELDVITVDLGFKGTIQRSLENALCLEGEASHLMHLLAFGCKENAVHLFNNMNIRAFVGFSGSDNDLVAPIMRSPDVLEVQILAAEGSTKGYVYNDLGQIVPVTDFFVEIPNQIAAISAIQEGVRVFQDLWLDLVKGKPWVRSLIYTRTRDFAQLVTRQINLPSSQEARVIGGLQYENNRWTAWQGLICSTDDEKKLVEIGPDRFWERASLGYQADGILWPQGVLTQKYPYFLMDQYALRASSKSQGILLRRLVKDVIAQGFKKVVVYGAGDVGRALVKAAQGQGLTIECVVDQKETLWGQRIAEVEITSLDKALASGCKVFLIGSFAFVREITSSIRNKSRNLGADVTIFSIGD